MKLALITDTHWGVRNDNPAFLDNNKLFLDNVFYPTLERENIRTVVHLGDLVDRRKFINFNTASRLRHDFLEPLHQKGIDVHILAGNHDTFHKNTNSINALNELVQDRYGFNLYMDYPKEVEFDNTTILMTPWICDENRKVSFDKIKSTPAQVLLGHLELSGFDMYRGSPALHGDDPNLFSRFDMVCSGHYHTRSNAGNITYLGAHAEFTWSDYNDPRGFHIFDTDTRTLTFIRNPYIMFEKVWYDDSTDQSSFDPTYLKNKIIKVIVTNKNDPYLFDIFISNIDKMGIIDLQIVEDHLNLDLAEEDDIIDEAESTLSIFKKYIDSSPLQNINKTRLENTVTELYNEALTIS